MKVIVLSAVKEETLLETVYIINLLQNPCCWSKEANRPVHLECLEGQ